MDTRKFAYIWQYTVDDAHTADFLAAYESTGTWAQLFLRDDSYLKTTLLVDETNPNRFMTIDYWTSKPARDNFKTRYRTEFDELDEKCEEFTTTEEFIGDFVIASGSDT